MEINIGDKFKGKINGAIFEIISINKKDGMISYKCENNIYYYGLKAFKNCLLEKLN